MRRTSSKKNLLGLAAVGVLLGSPLAAEVVTSTSTPAPVVASTSTPIAVSTLAPVSVSGTAAFVTIVYPAEGAKLPALNQIFVFGAVVPGSTLTINGAPISVHAKGGYLTMMPLKSGDVLLHAEARAPNGTTASLDRKFAVAAGAIPSPVSPLTLEKGSVSPTEDVLLSPGDTLRVTAQGSPTATAEFSVDGVARHVPMVETTQGRGTYEGAYVIQTADHAKDAPITVTLKKNYGQRNDKAKGRLTIDSGNLPRVGMVVEESVAIRTGTEGGYDLFLYKGMRVRLTGKVGGQWRVRLSSLQSGWVKDSAIQELPRGTPAAQGVMSNMTMAHDGESTILRVPIGDALPYRVEQTLEPAQLLVTLYGCVNKTDLIRYDPADPLIRMVRWKQLSPDTCQILVEPRFNAWWGFDTRYESGTFVVEVRKPWTQESLKGLVIAVDAGHGGSDAGAIGPHGVFEKDANLAIARAVKDALEKAGASPFLTRDRDIDVPLYERPRIAWRGKARLFISVHCNSSGLEENPWWNNGSSVYWNQPQSLALAKAVHAGYRKHVSTLPDRGLYYADFAVCRMTQMPAILTEQAYIIIPEQEDMLFDPKGQKRFANAIVNGVKAFVTGAP